MSKQQLLMFAAIGAAATVIGVILPWVTVSMGPVSMSANGFDAPNGTFTFILALVAAAFAGLAWQGKASLVPVPSKVQLLVAGGCLALAAIFMIIRFFDDYGGPASRGIGLYLATLGSVGGAVSMFLMLKAAGMLPKPDASGGDAPAEKKDAPAETKDDGDAS